MGLKEKVRQTLTDYFDPEQLVLDDDDAITGFLVSPRFKQMETFDRMDWVDAALATGKFTARERGKILVRAPLTPAAYRAVGPGKPKRAMAKRPKRRFPTSEAPTGPAVLQERSRVEELRAKLRKSNPRKTYPKGTGRVTEELQAMIAKPAGGECGGVLIELRREPR